MRLRAVVFVVLLALCLAPNIARSGELTAYYTDDPAVMNSKPPAGWTSLGDSGKVTLKLFNNRKIWFSFLNTPNDTLKKYFTMKIESTDLNTNVSDTGGFLSNLVKPESTVTKKSLNGYGNSNGVYTIRYRFTPQPKWERVGFKSTAAIDSVEYHVKAWSVCAKAKPEWPKLVIENAKFGTATPGGEPEPGGHIKELWWFPFIQPVDPFIIPTFVAPPATGTWTSEFVYADPDGDPRPLGGVRFLCEGAGLTHDDEFSLSYGAHDADQVDPEHELFAWDEDSQQWMDFTIDTAPDVVDVPTLSEWAMVILALVMITVAALYIWRRRYAT